jgi:GDPmannose 4,6-dehydratase
MEPAMPLRALITGITGQDGSYLAEFLLDRGYKVYGLIRRSSAGPNLRNIQHIVDDIELLQGDMTDSDSLSRAIRHSAPDEIYNLAAQSFVPMSWDSPTYTINVNLGGFTYLLEAVRAQKNPIKVYQASTSEMFGNSGYLERIQADDPNSILTLNENSPMRPRSPYGVSKLGAHRLAEVYRESFGMFVTSGILFNHESPRRGTMFVTRKITKAIAKMYKGRQHSINLGNLEARRDWGFAGDYVRAMWLMLQQDRPLDYVIGTGTAQSVETVVMLAFRAAEELTGKRIAESPMDRVRETEHFKRPAEIFILRADASRAVEHLGWRPVVDLDRLIHMMVKYDLGEEGVPMK